MPHAEVGHNSKVTDKFHLEKGTWKVTWAAQGDHFFAVTLHSGQFRKLIANVVLPSPSSGETVFEACPDCGPSEVGVFYLEVEAGGGAVDWLVTFTPL